MIASFSVENFRSIDDRITLSFEASAAIKDMDNEGFTMIAGGRILNAKAFFGANSSGKSNVFRAVARMRSLVIQSVRLNNNEQLRYEPFLLTNKPSRYTEFEMSFIDGLDMFRYGFKYNAMGIEEEWLMAKFPKRSLKTLLRRTRKGIETDDVYFSEGDAIKSGSIPLNNNRLFISLAAQLGGPLSNRIIDWFSTKVNVISGIRDDNFSQYTKEVIHTDEIYRSDILHFIAAMGVGFSEVKTEQVDIDELRLPKGLPAEFIASLKEHPQINAYSLHAKYNADGKKVGVIDFEIEDKESDGTRKLFNLAGPVVDTLKQGKILFVDELDAQLHPLLSRKIVNLFNKPQSNPFGAQLIFTTHDTNMLSKKLLRRDQVIFVEKDALESTHLTSMMDIKLDNGAKPRTDSNYEKNYLEGKYGAIPYFESDFEGC
jgi:AAA15 family ATPase/GTPase